MFNVYPSRLKVGMYVSFEHGAYRVSQVRWFDSVSVVNFEGHPPMIVPNDYLLLCEEF